MKRNEKEGEGGLESMGVQQGCATKEMIFREEHGPSLCPHPSPQQVCQSETHVQTCPLHSACAL